MRFVAVLLATLAAGCAQLHPGGRASVQLREIIEISVAGARAMPEEQRGYLAQAQQRYDALPDDANRLRLAALLATLPPPWRDDEKARGLLRPLAARRPENPLTQFAGMLAGQLAERQRLANELRAAEQRADTALQRADAAQLRAESAERREQNANERAKTLQSQVEALKSIERSILEREERRRNTRR